MSYQLIFHFEDDSIIIERCDRFVVEWRTTNDGDDTVCDCLLKLDISPSRHVLGKRKRMNVTEEERRRWHTKNGQEMKRREEDCEKRLEIMEEAYYHSESERERDNEERDYSSSFFFNMSNYVYRRRRAAERGRERDTEQANANSRKQRSAYLHSDLVCERICME